MKKFPIVAIMILVVFTSACSPRKLFDPTLTATPTISLTPTYTPTNTPVPTATATPTPQPTPPGGGGIILFSAYRTLFNVSVAIPPGEYNLYSANPDGGDLTPITQGPDGTSNLLAEPSPDGRQVLYYSTTVASNKLYQNNYRVDLWITNIQKTQSLQLSTNQVHTYLGAATWAPDGTIYFIGWNSDGLGLFHVKPDGTGLERTAKQVGPATGLAQILFFDSKHGGIFWVTGGYCDSNRLCGARYYYTSLDGSDQKQVWKWINNAATNLSLSPDGKWIAYERFISNQIQDRPQNGCYVAATDGSQIHRMVGDSPRCEGQLYSTAFWSPDSQYIMYNTVDSQQMKYPVHLYSPNQDRVIDIPDLRTPACFLADWLPDGEHILFSRCLSNFGGYDQYAPMRLVDLTSKKVTVYPATGTCGLAFSPDLKQVFLYDCYNTWDAKIPQFHKLDLETAKLSPLFTDALNQAPKDSWWMTVYGPAIWNKLSH